VNKVNQDTYAKVLKLLLSRPVSAYEIVDETGLHIVTAQSLMRTFKKNEVVHVCSWRQDSKGRDTTPVYEIGFKKDKPRRALTPAQRQQRHRDKKKGDI
jgi:predicted ArsR family transcriptional regulator